MKKSALDYANTLYKKTDDIAKGRAPETKSITIDAARNFRATLEILIDLMEAEKKAQAQPPVKGSVVLSSIDNLIEHYTSQHVSQDPGLISVGESSLRMAHLLETIKTSIVNAEFDLKAYSMDLEEFDMEGCPVKLKGNEDFLIIQPLLPLTFEEIEGLHAKLKEVGDTGVFKDKQVLIIPYDVRILRAKIDTTNKE